MRVACLVVSHVLPQSLGHKLLVAICRHHSESQHQGLVPHSGIGHKPTLQVNFTTHCLVNKLESGAEFSTTENMIYVSAFLLRMKHCEGKEEEMQLFAMMFK